ncbi:hypothetical protein ACLB2K_061190 [Fragaria x ananassa]
MASPSASVIHSEKKYDVFLNFRGPDTRLTFTSHLYKALNDMKINTYIDNRLDKGDDIAPALLKAIEESKISVIIFSEKYATSAWCLDELVHILKCQETSDAAYVIPVFYKIKPTDVRFQKGCCELEEIFKNRAKKELLLKWKDALTKASNLFGFDSSSNTVRDDSDLIEQVVKDVLKKLGRCDTGARPKSSSDLNGLLGGGSVIKRMDSFSTSLQFLPQDNIVRSAFIPISVELTPPFDEVFLSFMVTLHNLPRMLVHLNQTEQGRISLIVLLAAIPFTLDFIADYAKKDTYKKIINAKIKVQVISGHAFVAGKNPEVVSGQAPVASHWVVGGDFYVDSCATLEDLRGDLRKEGRLPLPPQFSFWTLAHTRLDENLNLYANGIGDGAVILVCSQREWRIKVTFSGVKESVEIMVYPSSTVADLKRIVSQTQLVLFGSVESQIAEDSKGEREDRGKCMLEDYFVERPIFNDEEFRVRYRTSHDIFNRICGNLCNYDRCFVQKIDAAKKVCLLPQQKMTSSLRMLAYGASADQCAEYCRMSKSTSIECLQRFTRGIVAFYSADYIRAHNPTDLKRLLAKSERRDFHEMIGSIDCMHWQWKNCPSCWGGEYSGRKHIPTIILEAVASYDTWI